MSNYAIMAYNPATNTALTILPDYQSADISFEFSDVGACTIVYPKVGKYFSTMALDRLEVAFLKDGVEMDDSRFRVQSSSGDEVKSEVAITFQGVSLLNRFKKAIVYSGDGSTTLATDQTFTSFNAGQILRVLFSQNAARGAGAVCNELTWASFSNTLDSAGNAWAFTLGSITYTVGVDYLSVIRNLVDNGMIEVKMVGRDLRVYNADGLGVDRTIGTSPVVLRKGIDYIEAPQTKTNEQIAAVALIQGDENVLLQVVDTGVASTWGRDEMFISQGGIGDSTTLGVLAAQQLELSSAVRAERTRKIAVHGAIFQPYTDYRVSDYIFNDSGSGAVPERLRIRQLVISIDQAGIQSASVVLNDKFLENEVAIARKVNGILGGASAGGSVSIPVDPAPTVGADTTIPSQVTGLAWTSAAFQDAFGVTRAQITATWAAVTTNTNASVIDDLDYYEVQVKANSGTDWGQLTGTTSTSTTGYFSVPPNWSIDVRVRAVDRNGNRGAFSTTVTHVTASDSTAPPVPSTPVVAQYLGQLRVTWDGLGSAAQPMPTDFHYTEVHLSTVTGFTPSSATLVDTLNAAGTSVLTKLTYGTPYFVKLISVDVSGNKSAASAQGTATPATVTGLDIAALTVDTSNLANLAVTTAKIGLLQVLNGQIANLAVDDAKIGNMSVGKLTAGILTADITVSARIKTANTGARVELNSTGLQAYDASSNQTVAITTTGAVTIVGGFKTAFTGVRLEMTNSTDRSTIEFYGTAVDPAFMNSPVDGAGAPRIGINSGGFTYGGVAGKHRLFLNNDGGIQLETYETADSSQNPIGYGLYLNADSMEIRRKNPSTLAATGGRITMDTSHFEIRREGGGVLNGGQIYGDTNNLFLEAQASGAVNAQLLLQDNGLWSMVGKITNNQTFSNSASDFIIAGSGTGLPAANTSYSVSYGSTATSTPGVVYGWYAGSLGDHRLSAFSTTGFTVTCASAAAKLQYWCFRQ